MEYSTSSILEKIKKSRRQKVESELEECKKRLDEIDEKTRQEEWLFSYLINTLANYSPDRLFYWMRYDTWSVYDGIAILSNIDPSSAKIDENGHMQNIASMRTLDGICLSDELLNDILPFVNGTPHSIEFFRASLLGRYCQMRDFWESGNHTEGRYPPKYFIDWAISKGMKPKWLDWAKENRLIDDDNKPEIEDREPVGKSRTGFQNAMAALFNELLDAKQERNPKITKTALIQRLTEKYSGVGITESFLTRNINDGQKNLQSKQ